LSLAEALLLAGRADEARQVMLMARDAGLAGVEADVLEARITIEWLARPDLATLRSLLEKGELSAAEEQARQQVERFGDDPALLGLLVELLIHQGRDSDALPWLDRWCAAAPAAKEAWLVRGGALNRLKRFEDAYRAYLKALALGPSDADTLASLGRNLRDAGSLEEAWVWLRLAVLCGLGAWAPWLDLMQVLVQMGASEQARDAFEVAMLESPPADVEAAHALLQKLEDGLNMDTALGRRRLRGGGPSAQERTEALRLFGTNRLDELGRIGHALCERFPLDPFGWKVLGVVLKVQKGDPEQALTALRLCAAAAPDDAEAHTNLAVTLNERKMYPAAEAAARRAITIDPQRADAHAALGGALQHQERSVEAAASLRRALELNPDLHEVRSSLQFALHFSEQTTWEVILQRAREYGRRVQVPAAKRYGSWTCEPRPARLRVGFVSGDLRSHPVGFFTEVLFATLDPERVELRAYVTSPVEDALTERIKPYFSGWFSLHGVGDALAAKLIHDDAPHILIDLSGYTAYNRLPVFARRPAPVQASWLGYFATTGVPQIDYFIGDRYVMPEGEESHFAEKLWRLPESFCCMGRVDTGGAVDLQPGPLPALERGHVTFGSFNKLAKISDPALCAWARILLAVPGSRLLLNARELVAPERQREIVERFAQQGVAADRLILRDWVRPRAEHLAMYREVDIALDPFPYVGGTTSFEALWMGVPVLTLKGDRYLSHLGESINQNAGLGDWIASTPDDYVARAVALSADLPRLAELRGRLRPQVMETSLFNAPRFARQFEAALWAMWEAYAGQGGRS
jgi:predicted O-linked N-acetylglucosamine transferase (SPINDLY family)